MLNPTQTSSGVEYVVMSIVLFMIAFIWFQ